MFLLKTVSVALGFPAELGRTILFELQLFSVRLTWRVLPKNRRTLKRITKLDRVRLNLGCGDSPAKGWINIDGVHNPRADLEINLRGRLPFASDSAHSVFSEHFIEHFRYEEGLSILRECHRILVSGGAMRVIAPDLRGMLTAYVRDDDEWFSRAFPYLTDRVKAINLIFHQGGAHHYIYARISQTEVPDQAQ